jgi:hypothetical protein
MASGASCLALRVMQVNGVRQYLFAQQINCKISVQEAQYLPP